MDQKLNKFYIFIKWYFIFMVLETIILLKVLNQNLLLFRLLINYLFLLVFLPLIFEKINKGKVDFFSPLVIFSLYYLLLFGIRAVDLIIFRPEIIIEDEKFYIYSLICAIIGLHFFQIGYFSNLGFLFINRTKKIPDQWSNTKFKIILIGYSLISILSLLIIIKISGGFSFYFSNIRDAMVNITSGKTIFFMSVLMIKIPVLLWFCNLLYKNKFAFSFFLYFGFVLLLLASLGERGHLISLVISMLICFNYVKKRLKLLPIFSSIVILILFLVVYGQYRDFTQQSIKIKRAGLNFNIGLLSTYNYFIRHFDQLVHVKDIIKYVPDHLDFQYGKTFLNLLVKPIPSVIWEDKPQGAGRIITKNLYPKAHVMRVTIAPSLLGELYLNFHLIGIISGMFLFGIVCKALYLFLKKNYQNKNVIIIYTFLLTFIYGELRGDFNVVTSFLIFNLIFLIIALKYITVKNQHKNNNIK